MTKRFDTGMASGADLSSLEIPKPIEGKDIFSCPMRMRMACNGSACLPEWNREEDDRSLHIFIYDETRTEKQEGTTVKQYHIVRKVLHHEGYCKLYMKKVWALVREEAVDLWYEEGRDEPDFQYILKPQEVVG